MKWRYPLLLLIPTLVSLPASALDKYLCVADKSTGFKWNGMEWAYTNFRIENDRFIVEQIDRPPIGGPIGMLV
jgi:hypothetical protein